MEDQHHHVSNNTLQRQNEELVRENKWYKEKVVQLEKLLSLTESKHLLLKRLFGFFCQLKLQTGTQDENQGLIATLEKELALYKQESSKSYPDCSKQLSTALERVHFLESQCAALQKQLTTHETNTTSNNNNNHNYFVEYHQQCMQIEILHDQLSTLSQAKKRLEKSNAELQSKCEQFAPLQDQVTVLQHKLDKYKRKWKRNKQQHHQCIGVKEQVQQIRETMNSWEQQMQDTKRILEQREQEIAKRNRLLSQFVQAPDFAAK